MSLQNLRTPINKQTQSETESQTRYNLVAPEFSD